MDDHAPRQDHALVRAGGASQTERGPACQGRTPRRSPTKEAEMYVEANIAAILTLATLSQTAAAHTVEAVIQRYKEVLQKLRTSSGGAFN
jgi:hypothetical protein